MMLLVLLFDRYHSDLVVLVLLLLILCNLVIAVQDFDVVMSTAEDYGWCCCCSLFCIVDGGCNNCGTVIILTTAACSCNDFNEDVDSIIFTIRCFPPTLFFIGSRRKLVGISMIINGFIEGAVKELGDIWWTSCQLLLWRDPVESSTSKVI